MRLQRMQDVVARSRDLLAKPIDAFATRQTHEALSDQDPTVIRWLESKELNPPE